MTQMRYFILMILFIINYPHLSSQGYIDMSQKWLYRPFFNPAAIGSSHFFELYAFNRNQWTGIEGAPVTQILSGHYFFPRINSGFGLTLTNDLIGFYHTMDVKAAYAYHVQLSRNASLSFGLAGNLTWMFRDDSKIRLQNPNYPIPVFETTSLPSFDTGFELRNRWLTFGMSAMQILNIQNIFNGPRIERKFQVYAVTRFNINEYISFAPSLLASMNRGLYDGEAGMMLYYRKLRNRANLVRLRDYYRDTYDLLWAGFYTRLSGSIVFLAGVSITEQWRLSYAYEHTAIFLQPPYSSTHEIMLSWRIPQTSNTPRKYLCDDC